MTKDKLHRIGKNSSTEILQILRGLQIEYFEEKNKKQRDEIEAKQRKLAQQSLSVAEEILKRVSSKKSKDSTADELMSQYGLVVDQTAILLPWSEILEGRIRDVQNDGVKNLIKYLNNRPLAGKVAKFIFMLYHHGAEIDKELTKEAYERMRTKQTPTQIFSRRSIEAEERGKVFLEKYIAICLGVQDFSLDNEYSKLTKSEQISDEEFGYVLDVANWYRRMAYYQKYSGLNLDKEKRVNVERAIELHKRLVEKDPMLKRQLEKLYEEQKGL